MQPFRTILFAADFSENSKEAFRAACSLAVENKSRILVLHVAQPNLVPELPVYFGQQAVQLFPAEPDTAHQEALAQELRKVYTPDHPLDIEYLTRTGDPSEEILRAAKETGSDLIVMGTQGRTGLRYLLAGSVAVAVVHRAPCPIMALRSTEEALRSGEIRVILHPTDFSADSEAALRVARELARQHGARLVILHVAMLEVLMDGTAAAELDPRVYGDALENVRKRVDGPDLKYPVETVLRRGYAAEEIIETAKEMSCDLIVMGTHGRTALGRLFLGSVAEHVLPKATCPVLIAKASPRVPAPNTHRPAEQVMTASC